MESVDLLKAIGLAAGWARQAGDLAWQRFGSRLSVSRKHDRSLLTEVDLQVQELLAQHVDRCFPAHQVIAEEGFSAHAVQGTPSRYTWVLDPLDGTRNYAHGLPYFSTSIGLLDEGMPVLGVIYEPAAGRLFEAAAGLGARLDGAALHVAAPAAGHDLLLGFPGGRNLQVPRCIFELLGTRVNLRNLGSTCLHLAFVAAGGLDAAYARRAKLWDLAAGAVLVTEAGGSISGEDGLPLFPAAARAYDGRDLPFVACAAHLRAPLLRAMELARPV